jgi:hypothetical protein
MIGIRVSALSAVVVAALSFCGCCHHRARPNWGVPRDGLRSKISLIEARQNEDAIFLKYQVQNVSSTEQIVWHSGFWVNHKIVAQDKTGNDVPRTPAGESVNRSFAPNGNRFKNAPFPLSPGEIDGTWDPIDVRALFFFPQSGKYSLIIIYEEYQPGGWRGRLESNTLKLYINQ